MIKNTSIDALIKLLDDSDAIIREHAEHTLLDYGHNIIPELIQLENNSFDNVEHLERIAEVVKKIRFKKIKHDLLNWKNSPDKNLLEALFIVCSYQFPEMQRNDFIEQFQLLNYQCWKKIHRKQTSFEKVEILNRIFFQEFEFTRASKTPYSPFEIFVNAVFDTREGTDFSLGLIYSVVAQSIGLPIYGVTTLNNRAPFVLAYLDTNHLLPVLNWGIHNNGVLFYIAMDEKGEIIDPKGLKKLYYTEGLPQHRAQFEPTANTLLIKRFLNDVKKSYANHAQFRYKLPDIDELLALFSA